MKSFRKELWFATDARRELINITPDVEACLAESGIREGLRPSLTIGNSSPIHL